MTDDITHATPPSAVERICHNEQLEIWTSEFIEHFLAAEFTYPPETYDDNIALAETVKIAIKDLVEKAFKHSELNVATSPSESTASEIEMKLSRGRSERMGCDYCWPGNCCGGPNCGDNKAMTDDITNTTPSFEEIRHLSPEEQQVMRAALRRSAQATYLRDENDDLRKRIAELEEALKAIGHGCVDPCGTARAALAAGETPERE